MANSLAVQYVISGSVTDLGERLQINVQLDDALEDTLLWSERYDVAAKDIERVEREIRTMQSLATRHDQWIPPIVKTVASKGTGTEELAETIAAYEA